MFVSFEKHQKLFCSSYNSNDLTIMKGVKFVCEMSFISESIRIMFHCFYLVVDTFYPARRDVTIILGLYSTSVSE